MIRDSFYKKIGMLAVALVLLMPIAALADSLSPATYTKTLAVGQTFSLNKTLIVNKGTPTTALVDIMFLTDSTGSMGGLINAVKTGATDIMNATKTLGNVSYAVADYKDVGDTYIYKLGQNFTNTTTSVQTAINAWSATGGGDTPEANLYALYKAADAAWRPGAAHILLWFGDAPGHDPTQDGVTVASAISKLQSKNIKVMAFNTTTSTSSNLNTWGSDTKLSGQATKVTTATAGTYFPTVDATNAVAKIKESITTAFQKYSSVGLDLSGVPTGLAVTSTPSIRTGTFDRSIDRSFSFTVGFTAKTPGTYNFNIYGLVDRVRVATEKDTFTVPVSGGRFGFRFDYGNGDWYSGYFYGKYTDYNVGWTKETSAGLYRILTKAYSTVATSYYGKVYLDKYWDTHSRMYYSGASLISMFGSYYGASYLGSESGWLIKAYTYPKYRFFGFGYYEADGVGPQV
jgi:hypothetical protein